MTVETSSPRNMDEMHQHIFYGLEKGSEKEGS